MNNAKYYIAILIFIALSCNEESQTGHTRDISGVKHKQDITYPEKYCSVCHGSDLNGTSIAVSCYSCHSDLWSTMTPETPSTTAPESHTNNFNEAYHLDGQSDAQTNCSPCHGDNLEGGQNNEPSCYLCHNDKWTSANHNVNKEGYLHAQGLSNPTENCTGCHGTDLRGGNDGQPSCYSCHGAEWNEGEGDDD